MAETKMFLMRCYSSSTNLKVFQIWNTSGTTYIRRLPGKSSGLLGSLLTKSPFHNRPERFGKFLCLIFLHLVSNQMVLIFHSFKCRSINFIYVFCVFYKGFSDLEDFWDDLPVSCLQYNALDDFQEVFQTTSRKAYFFILIQHFKKHFNPSSNS
ncbi:hypothetical protein IGI04_014607 [Brassica rapa subsp. trilocularis]|uniref:Uncharacterized protein n=1 Tax=Brassica rapa subsp. trilocularis TaxID=1813537 RepID=A0ABQ7MQ55_BRACM|nr:hypothetical protein IGI04_014607 [Brassica rapa subsp. trilocularis]